MEAAHKLLDGHEATPVAALAVADIGEPGPTGGIAHGRCRGAAAPADCRSGALALAVPCSGATYAARRWPQLLASTTGEKR